MDDSEIGYGEAGPARGLVRAVRHVVQGSCVLQRRVSPLRDACEGVQVHQMRRTVEAPESEAHPGILSQMLLPVCILHSRQGFGQVRGMDFRVTVDMIGPGGGSVIEEMFATGKEADAFVASLTQEGGVLDGLGCPVTIAIEEMCNGRWTVASRRLVRT